MGELLARNEVFLFAVTLLQRTRLLAPVTHQAPDPDHYLVNLTRIPDDFHVRIQPTECS